MPNVKRIPEGQNTIIPHLVVRGAADAIEFYKKAFGAVELGRMPMPDGKTLMHAHLRIGASHLFLVDEMPDMGGCRAPASGAGCPVTLHLYVEDVDAAFNRAVAAGAQVKMPLMDMFWGDRFGKLADPFGYEWSLASHIEDMPPEEMKKRGEAMMEKMGECKP
ncbi:MAG TPA: VOC family protein [Pirellulales bacterium]|jgi:uncharacterized glyoxalase superfamily protein PhnB|nr:VOC family protein [Pirellulales bacterium]